MTYTYTCDEHGKFDVERSMKDMKSTEQCPVCKKESTRVFAPTNAIWNVSGAFGKSK